MPGENKIQLEANLSLEKLVSELQSARSEADKLRTELSEANKKIKEGFEGNSQAVKQMGAELASAFERIKGQSETIRNLRAELENFQKTSTKGFDESKVEAYRKKIEELETELNQLKQQGADTAKALAQSNESTGKSATSLKEKYAQLKQEQKQLREEVAGYQTAIRATEQETKALVKELDKQTVTSREGRQRISELRKEIKLLNEEGYQLEVGFKNTKTRLEEVNGKVREYGKAVAASSRDSQYFEKSLHNITDLSHLTANVLQNIKGNIISFFSGFLGGALAVTALEKVVEGLKDLFEWVTRVSEAERLNLAVQKDLEKISDQVRIGTLKQRLELEQLLIVARDKNKTDHERELAIRAINDISPEYLGNITKENIETENTNTAITNYITSLEKKARAQAYISVIQEKFNDLVKAESSGLEENIKWYERLWNTITSGGNVVQADIDNIATSAKNRALHAQSIKNEIQALTDRMKAEIKAGTAELDLSKQQGEQDKQDREDRLAALRSRAAARKKERDEAKKAEAERLKALREEEARLLRILELEKQLAALKVDLLDDGKSKEIAQENARFEAAIRSLENLKKQSKTSQAEIRLIDQIIERQKELHNKKLLQIDQKYYEDAQKAIEQSQSEIDSVFLSGREKELSDLSKRYQKIIDDINVARKKALEAGPQTDVIRVSVINASADNEIKKVTDKQRREVQDINLKWDNLQLQAEKELALKSIDILRVEGLDERRLTELKESLKLETEKQFAKKRLDNLIKQFGLEQSLTEANIKKLTSPDIFEQAQAEGKDVFQFLGIEFSETDPQKLKQVKAELLELIGIVNTQNKKPDEDLFDFLGINPDTAGKIKNIVAAFSTIGQVASEALQPFIDGYDQRIQAIENLIQKLDDQISAQEDAVEREKELAEEGYANNLDIEQRKLADLKAQKQQELEEEKKLQEEKKKLQKAQILADSIAQGSNLITAATDIFKVLAKLGPIGIGIAIATIGVMLTGFIAAKAQALKAVGEAPTFAKGDRFDLYNALKGASPHSQGGVDVVDNKSGRKLAEFEGDEKLFVINKGSSKKYEPLLDAINRDELGKWTYNDLVRFIQPTGLLLKGEKRKELARATGVTIIQQNNTGGEQYLREIAETNRELLRLEKEREETTELPDKTILKKGNHTRIIHK